MNQPNFSGSSRMDTARNVHVFRDQYGIPNVWATSVQGLAFGQGQVVAYDRSWQLEWLRRRAVGTTSSIVGPSGRSWDSFARALDIASTAKRAFETLSEEARGFVAAYASGVNAGLCEGAPEFSTLGIKPEAWPSWMPLATFHAQHVLFAGLGNRLWERAAFEALGADADLLTREGRITSGSNAWVVGGGRTASGFPLIGGDPHRTIEAPGVYLQIRLACDEFDVVGLAFAGVPGIPHFAHTGSVAWAITNAVADYQDVTTDPADPEFQPGLHLRNASTVLGDLGFEALLPLLRSRTVDDVDRAFEHWVEPVNNVVMADRSGRVRYRLAGRIPTREGDRWVGWLTDTHRQDYDPNSSLVTANERRGPQSDAVGSSFAPPFRAQRITQLLGDRAGLTPADFREVLNDTLLSPAMDLCRMMPEAVPHWDFRMDSESDAAGAFAEWRGALVRCIAAEPVFDQLRARRHAPIFDPWLDLKTRIAMALPHIIDANEPFGIDLPALARRALDESRRTCEPWGSRHVLKPVHALDASQVPTSRIPRTPVSGDAECVHSTGSVPGVSDECSRGSVARYIWDLRDRDCSVWIVPLGVSGDPRSRHHHDQLPMWAAGDLIPVVTDWSSLKEDTSQCWGATGE